MDSAGSIQTIQDARQRLQQLLALRRQQMLPAAFLAEVQACFSDPWRSPAAADALAQEIAACSPPDKRQAIESARLQLRHWLTLTSKMRAADAHSRMLLQRLETGLPLAALSNSDVMTWALHSNIHASTRSQVRQQTTRAGRRPRPDRQHPNRPEVKKYFNMWRENPALYESAAAFVTDMLEKHSAIASRQLVYNWLNEWRKLET